jgi:uncharacterized membrane protein
MNTIQSSIEKGAQILFYWGALSFVFFMSKFAVQYMRRHATSPAKLSEKVIAYLGAAIIIIAGCFLYVFLGTPHGETMSQQDYQFTVTLITVLLGSCWVGLFSGYERDKKISDKGRKEFKDKINSPGGRNYAEY